MAFAVFATVTLASNAPTINPIPNPPAIPEDSGSHSVNLTGISDADGNTQSITITATSNNQALIANANIIVTYTGTVPAASTGSIAYTALAHQNGSAVITVTVTDSGGPSRIRRLETLYRRGQSERSTDSGGHPQPSRISGRLGRA